MELMKHQAAAVAKYVDKDIIPLFFDVGTGKTLTATAIAVEKYRRGMIDAVLIVAPNMVERQWARQELPKYFNEMFGDVDAYVYCNKKEKRPVPFVANRLNFCCVNIDAFSQPSTWERYVTWANSHKTMVIIDEATRIKNPKAKRTERIMYGFAKVRKQRNKILSWTPIAKARCILTGTPITRGATDLWSMYEFLQHNYFGRSQYAFKSRYTMETLLIDNDGHTLAAGGRPVHVPLSEVMWSRIKGLEFEAASFLFGITLDTYSTIQSQDKYQGAYKHIDELLDMVNRDAMTIRSEDVLELPDRAYQVKSVEMPPESRKMYDTLLNDMLVEYGDKEISASTKMVLTIRLNQLTSGFFVSKEKEPSRENYASEEAYEQAVREYLENPPIADLTWLSHQPKLEQLKIDLEELQGEPVIVCCHFAAEADRIYNELSSAGHKCCLITGHRKVGSVEGFQGGEYDVLVANVKVISTGLNLQHCHRMFFYNNTYSLEDRIQVEGRIYRNGQDHKCLYTDYIVEKTVDLKILANLRMKRQLSDYVKDKSAAQTLTAITDEVAVIKAITRNVVMDTEKEYTDEEVEF